MKFIFKGKRLSPDVVYCALIFMATLFIGWHLFRGLYICGVDMEIALIKVAALMQSWRDGLPLGRWSVDLNFGYGYPLLNYYSPLYFYCAAALGCLFHNPIIGMNACLFLIWFLSGLTCYLFTRHFWGREGAFVASIAYLYAPYHIWDVYSRGACAEFTAFVFLPLVLWSLLRLYEQPRWSSFLIASISFAGLTVTHNIMAMLITPLSAVYMIFLMVIDPQKSIKRMLIAFSGMACGILLVSYFWMPAIFEQQAVTIEKVSQGYGNYKGHFLTLYQSTWEAWRYCGNPNHGFQLGKLHVILAILSLGAWSFFWPRQRNIVSHLVFWFVLACLLILLTLRVSEPVWDAVRPLQLVNCSWRFFLILSFILSFFIGGIVSLLPEAWRVRCAVVLAGIIIFWYAPFCKPVWGEGTQRLLIPDIKAWLYTKRPMDTMEYMPREVKKIIMVGPAKRFEVLKGDADIIPNSAVPLPRMDVTVRSALGALICFHHYYFPGWTVTVDGRPVEISFNNDYGLILFAVPPGEHQVVVRFGQTRIRIIGEVISFVTALMLLGGSVAVWIHKKKARIVG